MIMNNVFHVVLALMSMILLARAAAVDANSQKPLLEQLCRHREDAAQVKRISEVKSMAALLEENKSLGCDEKVATAIKRLALMLEPSENHVCSPESIDAIIGFWSEYMSSKSKPKKHLPKSLINFFMAYGLQVSARCKKLMLKKLRPSVWMGSITFSDEIAVVQGIQDKIGQFFNTDLGFENLLVVIQAERLTRNEKAMVTMNSLQLEVFSDIRELCIKKFKPIYDILITPIVRLAAIGMNYKDETIAADMATFEEKIEYQRWFGAVLACEANLQLEPVEYRGRPIDSWGSANSITIFDKSDWTCLKERFGLINVDENVTKGKTIESYQESAGIADLVFDNTNAYLMRSVANHKYTADEMSKNRIRMLKRIPSVLKVHVEAKLAKLGLHPESSMPFHRNSRTVPRLYKLARSLVAGTFVSSFISRLTSASMKTSDSFGTFFTIIGSAIIVGTSLAASRVIFESY